MRIAIIGAGHVGLVSAACLSQFGFTVTCVDSQHRKVAALRTGEVPIHEPGLDRLLAANIDAGRLSFTADMAEAVPEADVAMLAVATPGREDGRADLSFVRQAARQLADALDGYTVLAIRSTVPVGTCREIAAIVRERRPDADFDIVSNPEFLREGAAISDFMHPDRVVVGVESARARAVMSALYRPLSPAESPILFTTPETAELAKYAANCFLATRVAFINEFADLCERLGADVRDLARAIGLDRRIGRHHLRPGPGFGGACLPKDAAALVRTARQPGAPSAVVEAVLHSNARRKAAMVGRIVDACGGSLAGKTVAVLGIAFKPATDTVRESPALAILPELMKRGAAIRAFDPAGMENARPLLDGVAWCRDAYDAATGADALLVLTEWNQFRALDLDRLRALLRTPLLLDLRNIYDPAQAAAAGLRHVGLGLPPQRLAVLHRVAVSQDAG